MNSKAFTLFTALVAFILIVLGVLIVQSMIQSESSSIKTIDDLEEQQELQAIADLARADALQTFNYTVRYNLEDYFSQQQNVYEIDADKTWKELIKAYKTQFFVGDEGEVRGFPKALATRISSSLTTMDDQRGYTISLTNKTNDLTEPLAATMNGTTNFLEIINCENDFASCNGSYYINLDFSRIDDKTYESFPFISVDSINTGRILQQPMLPRGNVKIYVPIRQFKAILGAKKLFEAIKTDAKRMLEWKLGFCGSGCYPSDEIETENNLLEWGYECPTETSSNYALNNDVGGRYYPIKGSDSDAMEPKLEEKIIEDLEQIIEARKESVFGSGPVNNEFEVSTKVEMQTKFEKTKTVDGTSNGLYCAVPEQITVTASFKEKNTEFMVLPGEHVYRIKLVFRNTERLRQNIGACESNGLTCRSPN